jgi:hypothetical protein
LQKNGNKCFLSRLRRCALALLGVLCGKDFSLVCWQTETLHGVYPASLCGVQGDSYPRLTPPWRITFTPSSTFTPNNEILRGVYPDFRSGLRMTNCLPFTKGESPDLSGGGVLTFHPNWIPAWSKGLPRRVYPALVAGRE